MRKALVAIVTLAFALPTLAFADELESRQVQRRAIDAAIWGMPAVNADLMRQEMLTKTSAKPNQIVYWGKALDWRNQTLTPNPDTIYLMTFFDTRDVGPVVIEIPPADDSGSLNGNIVTLWQASLEDVGKLGVDKGAGGKFVVLPPGYKDPVPSGYSALPCDTFTGFALLRSNMKSHGDVDVAESIAYGKRVKVYPLSAAGAPPETVFTDAKDVTYDGTIRYDASFYRSLDRVIQSEPWVERDRAMIDVLRSIGIEKGKTYAPTAATETLLTAAIHEARDLLEKRYDAGFAPFWASSHWALPAVPELLSSQSSNYEADHERYPVDARGLTYTFAYISIKHMGAGQFYLISIHDKDGKSYEGAKTYRLRVPPDVPIEQYWSVTVYDRQTHALVRGVSRASRSSQIAEMEKNADGSVDVYFGPKAPKGKEANFVPTDPKRRFELMFRLYAPKKEFFDKTWVLPDPERVAAR